MPETRPMLVPPPLDDQTLHGLPAHDREFARIEYARGFDYYDRRARAQGFTGHARVLDAACGVGQWSLALSRLNQEVVGIDFNRRRLAIARRGLAANPQVTNVRFAAADLHALPFDDDSFDLVFCYGVLMFLNEPKAIGEMSRVLRPGGRIYICANGLGWSLYSIWQRGIRDRGLLPFLYGIKGIVDTVVYKRILRTHPSRNTFLTRDEINRMFTAHGIAPLFVGAEGTYKAAAEPPFAPVYHGRYMGCDCVLEWVGCRDI